MSRFEMAQCPVTRFCQDEGVSVPSFYQWRKKLQQRERVVPAVNDDPASFAPVRVIGTVNVVVVRLPGGTQLDVPVADPQVLQLAIQTLAQMDAQRVAGGEAC